MAVLFIPLLFGLSHLYLWAQPDAVANDPLLQHKAPYLNVPFFIGRAIFYFVVWAGTILLLNRWWRRLAQHPSLELAERLRRFSGIGLALYGLTITFGAFDWLMSLNPDWYSTIFGILVAASQVCAALAFIIAVVAYLGELPPFAQLVSEGRVSDLGSLLLTAVIFWVYMAFVQFLIIWSGNLPEEVVWYVQRFEGGWSWLAVVILFLHAIIPFFLLLSNDLKRDRSRLAVVALMIFVADLLYFFWLVEPVFSAEHFTVHWLDIVTPIFLGGLWITTFSWRLRRRIPPQPPAQAEGVEVVDSAG
jgi:succinate dehydrogenase hydrophobic anchor subunit